MLGGVFFFKHRGAAIPHCNRVGQDVLDVAVMGKDLRKSPQEVTIVPRIELLWC